MKDQKQNWPIKPDGIVGASVCSLSGLAPGDQPICNTRFEYFEQGTVPAQVENLKRAILVNKDTGQAVISPPPGPEGEAQPSNLEPQEHQIIVDLLGTIYCLDCAQPQPTPGWTGEPVTININNLPFLLAPTP